jgi:hypothetical protein
MMIRTKASLVVLGALWLAACGARVRRISTAGKPPVTLRSAVAADADMDQESEAEDSPAEAAAFYLQRRTGKRFQVTGTAIPNQNRGCTSAQSRRCGQLSSGALAERQSYAHGTNRRRRALADQVALQVGRKQPSDRHLHEKNRRENERKTRADFVANVFALERLQRF